MSWEVGGQKPGQPLSPRRLSGLRLEHVRDVHGHLVDLRRVVLLNVSEDADIVGLDEVDGNALAAEPPRTPDADGPGHVLRPFGGFIWSTVEHGAEPPSGDIPEEIHSGREEKQRCKRGKNETQKRTFAGRQASRGLVTPKKHLIGGAQLKLERVKLGTISSGNSLHQARGRER